jgi:hypothetical protein
MHDATMKRGREGCPRIQNIKKKKKNRTEKHLVKIVSISRFG